MTGKKGQYAHLNQLTTQQLEELLRMDLDAPGDSSQEMTDAILEILERRERESPSGRLQDRDQAWREFQQYYSDTSCQGPLYPCAPTAPARPRVPLLRRAVRAVLAAAAVCLLGGVIAAQAAGLDVLGAIGRWTEEVFHFSSPTTEEPPETSMPIFSQDYPERNDAAQAWLASCGISRRVFPTRYLDGFQPLEPDLARNSTRECFSLVFTSPEGQFYTVSITYYLTPERISCQSFEKDGRPVTLYTSAGKSFYLFSNIDTCVAAWAESPVLVTIEGNIPEASLKALIDSIEG